MHIKEFVFYGSYNLITHFTTESMTIYLNINYTESALFNVFYFLMSVQETENALVP